MNLQSLSKYCGAINIPGLLNFEYAPTAWVDRNSYEQIISDDYNFQKDISFNVGGWLFAPMIPSKNIWNQKLRESKQGSFFQQRIKVIIPQLRQQVNGEFMKMKHYTYIIRLTDANGLKWLIGSLESPFVFANQSTTGAKNGDFANYELTWRCDTKYMAMGFNPVF